MKMKNLLQRAGLLLGWSLVCGLAWAQGVIISPTTVPAGFTNESYSVTFSSVGGVGPYSYGLNSGTLPPGLSLSTGGVLSGIPTTPGTYNFQVRSNALGAATASLSGTVNISMVVYTVVCPYPIGRQGESYFSSYFVDPPPPSFSISAGALPPGLSFNTTNGNLTGTPTTEGNFSATFTGGTITRQCNFQISPLVDMMSPMTTARQGVPYRSVISAFGGASPYGFSLQSGSLPSGLALNGSTGELSGTPNTPGSFSFSVRVTEGGGRSTVRPFTIVVLARPAPSNTMKCPLPVGIGDEFYSSGMSLNVSGVTGFAIIDGSLPSGLTLNTATGQISGVGPQAVTGIFTIRATLSSGSPLVADCGIRLSEGSQTDLGGFCPDQPDLVRGEFYSAPVIAAGTRLPFSYSLYQTTLPAGLTLNPATGLVSGTPTVVGNNLVSFTITDAAGPPSLVFASAGLAATAAPLGAQIITPLCTLNVVAPAPLSILTTSLPNGQTGLNYGSPILTAGGSAPLNFQVVGGSLPNGLSLSSSGFLSGIPALAGSFSFTVLVTDSAGQTASRSYGMTIFAPEPLRFLTSTLPSGTIGVPYAQTIDVTGGAPPYSFRATQGGVPGLTLSGNRLSGTPTTASRWTIQITVTDSAGSTIVDDFEVNVIQGNFSMACPFPSADLGAFYNSVTQVFGGTSPYRFQILDGSLPAGLSLNASSGEVSGRPTSTGVSIFTLGVTDARPVTTAVRCSIGVVGGPLRLITSGPIQTAAGQAYSGAIEAAGGRPPYRFGVLGNPAPGLNLAENGSLAGSAARTGEFPVVVEVRDAAGAAAQRTIVFRNGPSNLSFACPTAENLLAGVAANVPVRLNGGVAPYALAVVTGALPTGLSVSAPNASGQAALTGTPTLAGSFSFSLRASDATETSVTQSCTLRVTGVLLSLTTEQLPNGQLGTPYGAGLAASGGVAPYLFGVAGGELPPGLQLDAASGAISGTPLRGGAFTANFEVRDRNRQVARKSLTITIEDGRLPLLISTESPLSDGMVGRPYGQGFAAVGGTPPYEFAVSGSLPPGLNFDGAGISGTPTAVGEGTIAVTVRDSAGTAASKDFLLRVVVDPALNILTETLPDGVLNERYAVGVAAAGGTPPYSWSLTSGRLPAGLSFDSLTGQFVGTVTENGQFAASVLVQDASGSISRKAYRFEVRPAGVERLEVATASLAAASVGVAYNSALAARGGQGPFRWELRGVLPTGLSLSEAGAISGTARNVETRRFVVVVTDSLGLTASRELSLAVAATTAPGLTITGLPDALGPNASAPFGIAVNRPLGVQTNGRLILRFTPDPGHNTDDPNVRFGNSLRTFDFLVAADATSVSLPAGASVQTGTLAGTITITTELNVGGTILPGPSQTIVIRRAAPVITAVRLTRSGGGIDVRVEGFTNTRQLGEARVTFTFASGVDVTGASTATVNVSAAIQAWFNNAASLPFGGQFALTLPFTVSGDAANVTGVGVVITNSEGASNSVSAQ